MARALLDGLRTPEYDERYIQSISHSPKCQASASEERTGTMPPRRYSMEVRSEQAARTRERILDAALASYRERGIASTSLQAVARRADVSAATVLNHFGSADELARVVVGRLADALRVPDDREWPEQGRTQRVRRLVGEMFAFYDRSAPWFEIFRSELGHDPALREGEGAFWQSIGELYSRVFGDALADDRVRGAAFGLTHPGTFTSLRDSGLSLEDASELVAEALVRLLPNGA
ncbi:MAG: TetR/AcrR family transcriptional regulator [Propionibacteriaceae bacterium]|nr:TetR/AcrR family transcriptional regulator [Propionibacteriaceae bacterium]